MSKNNKNLNRKWASHAFTVLLNVPLFQNVLKFSSINFSHKFYSPAELYKNRALSIYFKSYKVSLKCRSKSHTTKFWNYYFYHELWIKYPYSDRHWHATRIFFFCTFCFLLSFILETRTAKEFCIRLHHLMAFANFHNVNVIVRDHFGSHVSLD